MATASRQYLLRLAAAPTAPGLHLRPPLARALALLPAPQPPAHSPLLPAPQLAMLPPPPAPAHGQHSLDIDSNPPPPHDSRTASLQQHQQNGLPHVALYNNTMYLQSSVQGAFCTRCTSRSSWSQPISARTSVPASAAASCLARMSACSSRSRARAWVELSEPVKCLQQTFVGGSTRIMLRGVSVGVCRCQLQLLRCARWQSSRMWWEGSDGWAPARC